MTNVGTVTYIASIDTSQLKSDAKVAEKVVDTTGRNIESSGKKSFSAFSQNASNSFNNVAGSIAKLATVAAGLFIGGAFGAGAFVKQASELQGIRSSFESMTGSAEEATKVLRQLNKFSFETAFSSQAINAAARGFLSSGVAVKDLGRVLKQAGDIAGATGADLGRLTLPLSQSISNGKLDLENFYQIADSGAGKLGQVIREKLVKRGFKTLTEANEQGVDTLKLLLETMEEVTKAGGFAFEGALKQSRTFEGQLSNLQETIGNVALELLGVNKATGEIDPKGIFAKLSKAVQDATEWLNENKETIKDVAKIIIANAVPAILALGSAFLVAKVAAIGFSIAANANPIGLIAIAVSALVGAIVFLQLKFGILTKAMDAVNAAAQPFIQFFGKFILPILQQIGSIIAAIVVPAMNEMFTAFQNLVSVLKPFEAQLKILGILIGIALVAPLVILTATVVGLIGVFTALVTAAIYVNGKIAQLFNAMVSGAKTAANQIAGLVSVFTKVGSTIGDVIGNAFRNVVNGVLRFAVNKINSFIDAINGAVDTINKIPGVGISKLGRLPVPQLAKGGIVTSPTLAMIGEGRESEAVIPLSKLDKMINNGGDGNKNSGRGLVQNFYPKETIDVNVLSKQIAYQIDRG